METNYDVIVIGGGPGGYVAAIRCAQLGLKTACIDSYQDAQGKPSLGGTCLNAGCIPSKALLESSHHYEALQHQYKERGIEAEGVSIDVEKMVAHKNGIVKKLTSGIAGLLKGNKIEHLAGYGCLLNNKQVRLTPHKGKEVVLQADNIILATGSRPVDISSAPLNGETIIDSTDALNLTEVPERLGIIGAGVIGLELGSVWRRLGSKVIVLEAQDDFLAMADRQVAKEALRQLKSQGMDIRLGARVLSAKAGRKLVNIDYQDKDGEHSTKVDKLIVAVGRAPNTDKLFAPEADLLLDERGYVNIDEQNLTNLPGVYAIGDIVSGPMLAHKASEEGVCVAEIIAGKRQQGIGHAKIPSVIYTLPEVAWVGKTEDELVQQGTEIKTGVFPFAASGRALAIGDSVGFVKVIADANSDRILGAHIIGPQAGELIAEMVTAMEFSASSEDIADIVHSHPTLSECIHEACLALNGRAIHKINR